MKEQILHPSAPAVILGVIIGLLFSLLHYKLVEFSIKDTIKKQNNISVLVMFLRITKPYILAVPVVISLLIPKYVSLFGAFAGVMMPKLILFFSEFMKRKR